MANLQAYAACSVAAGAVTPHYDLVSTYAWATPERVGERGNVWPEVPTDVRTGQIRILLSIRHLPIATMAATLKG